MPESVRCLDSKGDYRYRVDLEEVKYGKVTYLVWANSAREAVDRARASLVLGDTDLKPYRRFLEERKQFIAPNGDVATAHRIIETGDFDV